MTILRGLLLQRPEISGSHYINHAKMTGEEIVVPDFGRILQNRRGEVLVGKDGFMAKEYGYGHKVAIAGGVASNTALREG